MRRALLITAVLAAGLVAVPGASGASKGFYGVVSGKYDPTAADFDRMGKANVGSIRVGFAWASVQTDSPDDAYDWSRYDAFVGGAAENGIEVLPTIYGMPGWVSPRPNIPPPPSRRDEFEDFMRAAVERYGPNGTFWLLNPLVPKLPVRQWQLFNEVNSPTFWLKKPKAKQYKPFLVSANRAIKGTDPDATLVLAGLFMTPRIKNGVTLSKYLTDLYRLKTRSLFDAVAVHPYSVTPSKALAAVEETRRLMRRFKDGGKPILLTEVGWATAGQRTPLTVKPGTQARYLTQTYGKAAKKKRLGVAGVYWYTYKDQPGSNLWLDNTGLITAGGSAKPAWSAFLRLTGGSAD